jgi:hypothetical protein
MRPWMIPVIAFQIGTVLIAAVREGLYVLDPHARNWKVLVELYIFLFIQTTKQVEALVRSGDPGIVKTVTSVQVRMVDFDRVTCKPAPGNSTGFTCVGNADFSPCTYPFLHPSFAMHHGSPCSPTEAHCFALKRLILLVCVLSRLIFQIALFCAYSDWQPTRK